MVDWTTGLQFAIGGLFDMAALDRKFQYLPYNGCWSVQTPVLHLSTD